MIQETIRQHKYILHTVSPTNKNEKMLESCYESCLAYVLDQNNNIKSIAFCFIATVFFYFQDHHVEAAEIALYLLQESG